MPIKIIIEKTLEPFWGADDPKMDDAYIIELVNEDIAALLDGATWTVKREGCPNSVYHYHVGLGVEPDGNCTFCQIPKVKREC